MVIAATTGPSVRARTRTNTSNNAPRTPGNPGAAPDWAKSGAAAIQGHEDHQQQVAQRREERQAEYGVPFRHWLVKGDEVDAIILDNDFGPGIFEHDLTHEDRFKRNNPKNGRPMDIHVSSPIQCGEADPITQATGKEPYYITFLTVGILKPYTDSKGRTHNYQRRLLGLKGEAMEMMTLIRSQMIKQGHTNAPFRGVQIVLKRGNGDQSLRTGLPMFIERHSEQDILETFGHPEVRGEQDGKLLKVADEDAFPIDYARGFPKPSADAIRARFNLGGSNTSGSRSNAARHFDDGGQGGAGGGNDDWANREGGFGGNTSQHFDDGGQGGGAHTGGYGAGSGGSAFDSDLDDDVPF